MVAAVKSKKTISKNLVLEMRQSGMPMREIAEKIGRSKERVRQILMEDCGSTNHAYLSTLQLCKQSGLPRNRIIELYLDGIIVPAVKWDAGNRDYMLWHQDAVVKIIAHYQNHRLCKVCNRSLPKNRIYFCSDNCRQERHKYKYMTHEEKKRVLDNIRRYREKRKITAERPLAVVFR
jgi:predicted nucleic acid-binding Zn ribbon protein